MMKKIGRILLRFPIKHGLIRNGIFHEHYMHQLVKSNPTRSVDVGCDIFPRAAITVDINRKVKPSVVADIRFLPFRNKVFKQAICSHVLEHLANPLLAISEMKRISEEIVGGMPNRLNPWWKILNFEDHYYWSIHLLREQGFGVWSPFPYICYYFKWSLKT